MNYTLPPREISGFVGELTEPDETRITVTVPACLGAIELKYRDSCYWAAAQSWLDYGDSWTSHVEAVIWDILDPDVSESGEIEYPELNIASAINHMTYEIVKNEPDYSHHFQQLNEFVHKHHPDYYLSDCLALQHSALVEIAIWVMNKKRL